MHTARGEQHYSAVLEILWEVHSALSFLHEQGIVHADLKMDNILLQESSSCAKGFVCKVFTGAGHFCQRLRIFTEPWI
jgi:serine/threonine protein kinase